MDKPAILSDLKKRILTLELEPSSSLDEVSLSRHYQISRTPMRELLQSLAGEGYVEIVNNRGASVSAMSHTVLRDFFLIAPMIYSAVGRLAAQNAKPNQITEMRSIQEKFETAIHSGVSSDMVYWNQCFHSLMGEMAANPYLKPSYGRLLIDHARISQTFYRPRNQQLQPRLHQALDHHHQMIAAIEAGDSETMALLIVDHWELSRDLVDYLVKPDSLDYQLSTAREEAS